MPYFVLSPCGVSLLKNNSSVEEGKLLGKHANTKYSNEIASEEFTCLQRLIERTSKSLDQADLNSGARASAELNAITKLYRNCVPAALDCHVLLCTDTWLGESVALLLQDWINERFHVNVHVERQKDLQTKDLDAFQVALSELVEWCEVNIPSYRQRNYRIVFNLTGGFKSVNGFLQALAMIYADEAVYVFESETDLLRLPRLPIQVAGNDAVRSELIKFRRLANGLGVEGPGVIAETLLWEVGKKVGLSPWGELVWGKAKKDIYSEKLLKSPSAKIRFGENFEKSLASCDNDRLFLINSRIDDLAVFMETDHMANRRRLDLKKLQGKPVAGSTHEIDAWSDVDAKRMFGHFEGDVFVIDRLDKALH